MIRLITSQVDIQLGVSCLILVSQHYHQVIHNRRQHGSSRRLNPAWVRQFGRTRMNGPPYGNALPPSEALNTTRPFSASSPKNHVQLSARLIKPPTCPGDPHSTLRTCVPKCRLQKIHLGTRGTHLHMMQQMERLN